MFVTREMISGWFDEGVSQQKRWMIIGNDSFSYEYFPAYVAADEDVREKIKELQNPNAMSRVEEVYDLTKSKEAQLNEERAWNV